MGPLETFQEMIDWYASLYELIRTREEYRALFEDLPKELSGAAPDYTQWRSIFKNLLNHCIWSDEQRVLVAKAILELTRSKYSSVPSYDSDADAFNAAEKMKEQGYLILPSIDAARAREMREYFQNQKLLSADRRSLVSLHEPNSHGNTAEYPMSTVVSCPHFMDIVSDPRLLSIVENYLGVLPTATIAQTWWSFAGKSEAKDAQLFHFDYADFRFCNLFIYLTDVDMESGPHVYVHGTHTMQRLLDLARAQIPDHELREFMNWYSQSMRKSDSDVTRYFGRQPTYFTGPAGTLFLVDTRGIHKGLLPKKSDRLLAQVTYSVSPALQTQFTMTPLQKIPGADRLKTNPYRYTFRLLVEQA